MTQKERYQKVLEYFESNEVPAETELLYDSPFALLVAVILSAQCTDKRVNMVTPRLLEDFPDATTMAEAEPETIFEYIRSISYPNNKAKHLVNMARMLLKDFKGEIPGEVDQLVKLPGVGRKTANVIASVVFDQPTMAVDTHVYRVSERIGLTVNAKNPLQCEKQLIKFIPKQLVPKAHHWLILHGRYICLARNPRCGICPVSAYCKYFEKVFLKQSKHTISTKNKTKTNGKKSNKKGK
jgi:endonuclease III